MKTTTTDMNRLDVLYAKLGELKVSFDVLGTDDPSLSEADRVVMLKALTDDAETVTTEMAAIFARAGR